MANEVFGKLDRCLHCAVWDLIQEASPKAPDGQAMYPLTEILSGLGEVTAEIIAAHPSRDERRRLCRQLDAELTKLVAEKRKAGTHPKLGGGLH